MKVLAIARASFRRLTRDRRALFFTLVLPILVIVIIGATVRGFGTLKVGIYDAGAGQAGQRLTAALEHAHGLQAESYPSLSSLERAVARGNVQAGVVLPDHMTSLEQGSRPVAVGLLAERANNTQQAAATEVTSVIAAQGATVEAARIVASEGLGSFQRGLALAATAQRQVASARLRSVQAEAHASTLPGGFSYSAPTELVLFVFLSALAAGANLIESRRLGIFERMTAAPVRPVTIIVGESLTYIGIALLQTLLIVVVGSLAFGVSWGNPAAALPLAIVWCLVGAGAGMLAGTLFRTPEQATSLGPIIGIALAMLGGCMWPLAIVSSTMRTIGHLTPQAWAVDGWTAIIARNAGPVGVARDVGILALFAVGFFVLATVRFRRHFLAAG